MSSFDALLVISFGGPEKHEDVIPFLENVLRGRNVPRERMLAVAEHYYHFDGRSPINDHNRELIAALRDVLKIPVYWGNRNWHPMLADTVRQMHNDGIKRAIAFATSAFGSYSGCRQYLEDIARARAVITDQTGENAPEIVKIRPFSDHPLFLEAMTERVKTALSELQVRQPDAHSAPNIVFTAHSIPMAMAQASPYVEGLEHASKAVAEAAGVRNWKLAYQSRSGPPTQPWLVPDIGEYLRELPPNEAQAGVIIVPIGFLSDHMEVLYDLDVEAGAICDERGIAMVRASTVGTHPAMIRMIAEMTETEPEQCPGCCAAPVRPGATR